MQGQIPVDGKRGIAYILLAVSIALLSSCFLSEAPVLRIGSNQWIGYEPVFLARAQGFLDEDRVHLVEMRSSTQVATQIRKGNLEGGLLTLDEVLSLVDAGIDMRIVTILDISNGADAILARPGIDLQQLAGKKIGVENTAVGAIMLGSALRSVGLEPSDITIVPVQADNQYKDFMSNKLDAMVTFDPVRTRLLKQGAVQIYDSSMDKGLIMDVMAIRADKVKAYRENITDLVKGYFQARAYMREHPNRALLKMSPRIGITPLELKKSYEGVILPDMKTNREWMNREKFDKNVQRLTGLMKRSGLVSASFSPGQLVDSRFLEQLD